MSIESATKVSHTCSINNLVLEMSEPLQADTLTLLFNSLEAHHEIWGPRTQDQCLRGKKHTDACIKDLTLGQLDNYVRKVQTVFLQKTFAHNWGKPFMGELIQAIPKNALEAFRFLLAVPGKKRPEFNDIVDFRTDSELFKACSKTQDVACCIAAFDEALATKDAELITCAFEILPGNSGKVAKYCLEKVHNILFLLSGHTDKDFAISKRFFTLIGSKLSESNQELWGNFRRCFKEYYRIDYQLDDSMLASAYSTTKQATASLEADSPLYDHLRELMSSDDPQSVWNAIPAAVKKEQAVSFACLFLRIRLSSVNAQQKESFLSIKNDFAAKIVKGLDKKLKASIEFILKADTFLYKFISPVTVAEKSRLNQQLEAVGTNFAYSVSKEDVVEADKELYVQLKRLNKSLKIDETWKAIPVDLKKEYALTFALLLAKLLKNKKEVKCATTDFYQTIVSQLDLQTQKWIRAIIREP